MARVSEFSFPRTEMKTTKLSKCKVCRQPYAKRSMSHKVCSVECSLVFVERDKERTRKREEAKQRKQIAQRKEAIKSIAQLAKEAEYYVNRYVRLRDKDKGCISCDKPASWQGQWHASHLKSVGANSALRFHLWNIHKACSICNNHLSGNIASYRERLPERIGVERFNYLESAPRNRTYSREYLVRLKRIFAKRCRIIDKM